MAERAGPLMTDNWTGMADNWTSAASPWVMIAGGFHQRGGMDKANAALAQYLAERGTPVHLVAHRIDPLILKHPLVTAHLVPRPLKSFLLGELCLEWYGRATAMRVTSRWPNARVLVNGGNCKWNDLNWVHFVHHAWENRDRRAPAWFSMKDRLTRFLAKRRERNALNHARIVLANSERTRNDLIAHFKLDPRRVFNVYLGSDSFSKAVTPRERVLARDWLGIPERRPLVVFIGALGHDQRKGFDVLWSAWRRLCESSSWDAELVVAGDGGGLARWKTLVEKSPFAGRVRLLGFTERVPDLLAAADLLVSPVRYEAYGLNVQEAICRGVPAMVSACAGIAERYPQDLLEMVLPDAEDVGDLVTRMLRWRSKMDQWKISFAPLALTLRNHTWNDMAREIVSVVEHEGLAGEPSCFAVSTETA
ncbi:MAG TPA: glycosyltransferase family 4 protein [Pyrinomonadaceae bacterium]|nr:glycosyltransferase family 4 protein [Pyrinomonadaceae bacterium]